jgi:hypothetical protein
MLSKLWDRIRKKEKAKKVTNSYGGHVDRRVSRTTDDGIYSNPLHPLNPINPLNSSLDDDHYNRRSQSNPTCYTPTYSPDSSGSTGRGSDTPSDSPSGDGGGGGCGGD